MASVCRPLRYLKRPCFPELAFFDVHEGTELGGKRGGSLSNRVEAEFAAILFKGKLQGPFLMYSLHSCVTLRLTEGPWGKSLIVLVLRVQGF